MTDTPNEPWFALERELRDDASGQARDRLLQRLAAPTAAIKRQLDAGAAPAEFARLEKVYKGLEAATGVVNDLWRRHHPARR